MKWYTHLACITLILAAISRFFPLTLGFILFSLIGSILPDLLEVWLGLPHRSKYVHNLVAAAPLILLGVFSEWIMALGLAYAHHVVLDVTTVTGSYIYNQKIRGPLRNNNLWHNLLIILAHLLVVFTIVLPQ